VRKRCTSFWPNSTTCPTGRQTVRGWALYLRLRVTGRPTSPFHRKAAWGKIGIRNRPTGLRQPSYPRILRGACAIKTFEFTTDLQRTGIAACTRGCLGHQPAGLMEHPRENLAHHLTTENSTCPAGNTDSPGRRKKTRDFPPGDIHAQEPAVMLDTWPPVRAYPLQEYPAVPGGAEVSGVSQNAKFLLLSGTYSNLFLLGGAKRVQNVPSLQISVNSLAVGAEIDCSNPGEPEILAEPWKI